MMKRTRMFLLMLALPIALGCGTKTGNGLTGNVAIQSNPLAGPNQAYRAPSLRSWLFDFFDAFLTGQSAWASVTSFTMFRICNDTLVLRDINGTAITINGSGSEAGAGLLDFSPTSPNPMVIATLTIPPNTVIREVDITFAVVPALCQSANYAVRFDTGSGPIDITQNTAFKFPFPSGDFSVTGDAQTITLLFGDIVNGMAGLGTGLDNNSIQTVNVGQAR